MEELSSVEVLTEEIGMSGGKEDPSFFFFSNLNLFFNCYLFTKLNFDTRQQVKKMKHS